MSAAGQAPGSRTMDHSRAMGAVVGTAVADALGAPFEFRRAGLFSSTYPDLAAVAADPLPGGGVWGPGEWTDDTQMALLVADSLLAHSGFDPADMFERFRTWAAAPLKDIGISTSSVLRGGLPWDLAAIAYCKGNHGHCAGNGSVMRAATSAVCFARAPLAESMARARDISALTHADPEAGAGVAIFHGIVHAAMAGDVDPLDRIPELVASNPGAQKWAEYLDPSWEAKPNTANGDVWNALAQAVWVLRRTDDYPQAMADVIDLGNDTDTVAAIAGGLMGAMYGVEIIPEAWRASLLGHVPGFHSNLVAADLEQTALQLLAVGPGSG